MNRRSFFWFLPALPAAALIAPRMADGGVFDDFDFRLSPAGKRRLCAALPTIVTNNYAIDSRTDRADIIAMMRESERITKVSSS